MVVCLQIPQEVARLTAIQVRKKFEVGPQRDHRMPEPLLGPPHPILYNMLRNHYHTYTNVSIDGKILMCVCGLGRSRPWQRVGATP